MLEYIKVSTYADVRGVDVKVWVEDDKLHYSVSSLETSIKDNVSDMKCEDLENKLKKVNIPGWARNYEPKGYFVLDGISWTVKYKATDTKIIRSSGDNAWPREWALLLKVLRAVTGGIDYFDESDIELE